jgi:PEP-CTERM motif
VTHNLKSISILAVCCVAMAMIPAAADTLDNYLGTETTSGQAISYAAGSNTFTDGNLIFQFTGLTITPTCIDSVTFAAVSCAAGSYNPAIANQLQVIGTLGVNGYAGFDVTGQVDVNSYLDPTSQDQIDVKEDINLNYTVSTNDAAATISDAHLDVAGCVTDPAVQSGCLSTGTGLPPKFTINENFAGTNQTIQVSAPPPVLGAFVNFLPNTYSTLQVTKDIFMDSGACNECSVSFSDLKQYYSQVPEPRTYAWFLGLGLLGLIQVRRRFSPNV